MRLFSVSILLIYAVTKAYTGFLCDSTSMLKSDNQKNDKEESVFNVKIPEPSGLAFSASKDALYTVSDKTGGIYRISFSGKVEDVISSGKADLEGIDVDRNNGDIWIVEEKKQHIYHLDKNGVLIGKITDVHVKTKGNSGFEGIAKNGDKLYILLEKDPGTLIVYDISSKKWDTYKLSFAKDYSGIDYDSRDNTLWIVSDESKTLNHCKLDGSLIDKQKIDVEQAEGVAVDRSSGIAWIISDAGHKLHRIKIEI